mmetsp:Transcript_5100/g.15103  ORF Transcript_5100/g.15103 Transcript_5100/m.15103 type:complete len:97 (-) Transcript_5100:81-371(-)
MSIRAAGQRVAVLELDPSTTLTELIRALPPGVARPEPTAGGWTVPLRDGSACGPSVPVEPGAASETLQALGWWPSGVLEIGDAAARPAPPSPGRRP